MKSIAHLTILTLASLPLGLLAASAANQEIGDKDAIFNNAKGFVDAFEKGDAKAVAAFWAKDGDYVDLDGRHLRGRAAIEDAFKEFFEENKGLKLRIDVKSVRFVTPDVAIGDRTSSVIPPDGTPPKPAREPIRNNPLAQALTHNRKETYPCLTSSLFRITSLSAPPTTSVSRAVSSEGLLYPFSRSSD
jgi:uncharacterized protein (TIGR02246 family)